MCVISEHIRLCTCNTEPLPEGTDYWVLHRYNPDKDMDVVGEIMLSLDALDPDFESNKQKLKTALNEFEVFDKPMKLYKNDFLELNFHPPKGTLTYGFKCKNKKWVYEEFHPLELMNEYDEVESGVVEEELT